MRVVIPLIMVVAGAISFFTTLTPSYSQAVPGIVQDFTKEPVTLECASHTALANIMKGQRFKIIAYNSNPLRMIMINPQGHILVVLIVDDNKACLLANLGDGTQISDELQLYLDTFRKQQPPL